MFIDKAAQIVSYFAEMNENIISDLEDCLIFDQTSG